MSIIDFISFIFVFGVTAILFLKKKKEERQHRSAPHEQGSTQHPPGQTLQEFFEALRRDVAEDEVEDEPLPPVPPPRRPVVPIPKTVPSLPKQKHNALQQKDPFYSGEQYEVIHRVRVSRGESLVKSLKSKRDMLILKEIFDKPLSLREKPFREHGF